MRLHFITGNKNKFEEVKAILGNVEQLDIDLPEIQEIDPLKIVTAKLYAALNHHHEYILVEDISLYLDCLNGLPGPLIKWFLKTIGIEGLYAIAEKFNNYGATAKVVYGYAKNKDQFLFFEGEIRGKLVSPRGNNGFGFDSILKPEGYNKTFAEMTKEEKNEISARRIALNKIKQLLKRG